MCGIAGLYSPDHSRHRSDFHALGRSMHEAIAHRGPDSHDIWQDPDKALLLAHRRLAILDLSPEGHQPMTSASGRYVIAYNGEIYNYLLLQKDLIDKGHNFRGRSDTEVILAAIEQWGLNEALQKINGMFAIALWDCKSKELHLIRDRAGKKPIYCGWADQDFTFASELKAIRKLEQFQPKVNQNSLNLYMRFGYVCAPHTIHENIWMIPPGHRLTITQELLDNRAELSHHMQPYWNANAVAGSARQRLTNKSDEALIEEFDKLLGQCVKDRMISDVPLGAFLSGGIDSSSIVAQMRKHNSGSIKTYSIGFHETGFDEAVYAQKVATHLETDHHELYVSAQDARDVIPMLPDMYDEPFADISAIPTYLVSKFARESVTVALSGDGGDEMLGGYNRHITAPAIWKRMQTLPSPLRRGIGKIIQNIPTSTFDKLRRNNPQFGTKLHKAASIFGLSTQEEIYLRLLSEWPEADSLVPNSSMPKLGITQTGNIPLNLNFAETMMLQDFQSYLPDSVLTKVDRASMAVSLEARAPLLDKRIFDYVWTLPLHTKIRSGSGKWLLRESLARHVPRELFERPKQGFTMPVGEWLRAELRDWAEHLLSDESLDMHGLLNKHEVRTAWTNHLNGHGLNTGKLWNILMFQAWHERWA